MRIPLGVEETSIAQLDRAPYVLISSLAQSHLDHPAGDREAIGGLIRGSLECFSQGRRYDP